jgi:hypothetical protein
VTSVKSSTAPEWYAAPELLGQPDETTVSSQSPANFVINPDLTRKYYSPVGLTEKGETTRNGKEIPTLSMLSAYGGSEPVAKSRMPPRYSVVASLMLIAFFVVVSFGGWYVWARRASAGSRAEPPIGQEQSAMGNQFASPSAAERSPDRRGGESADAEWEHLKQERINASTAEKGIVIAALKEAERKYPNDYRFTYERAKLSIKGVTSHYEAFTALALAAEKAIDNGQAEKMLENLKTDADGDFWKPAHGHHQWHALLEALESRDKENLEELRN